MIGGVVVFPLIVSWFLTFGYVPSMADGVDTEIVRLDPSRIATVAQLGFSVATADELFRVYTDVESFQYIPDGRAHNVNFHPIRVDYSIGFEIRPSENFRINIDHECDHPIVSRPNGRPEYRYGSEVTKITFTLQGKTKIGGK